MRIPNLWVLVLGLATFFSSCKNTPISSTPEFKPLNIESVDVEYLSLRSKVNYDSPDFAISTAASVRIKKDSIIWVSIAPALGIEAARVMITPDTMLLMNKFNREVIAYNFDMLSQQLNFPVNFGLIQSALLGNLARPMTAKDKVSEDSTHFKLTQDWGRVVVENYVDQSIMKIDQVYLEEPATQNTLSVKYGDFSPLASFLFPHNGVISLQYTAGGEPAKTQIDISHNRVEVPENGLRFPFSIPSNYAVR